VEDAAEASAEQVSSHEPAEQADADLSLPLRQRGEDLVLRGVRLADDPEVLERLLAALLELP
jgi:hypothetical protein